MSRAAGQVDNTDIPWCRFIYNDDEGLLEGAADGTMDGDADGVLTSRNTILVDLSHALSIRLGRQMSMMHTYKVDYISIQMRNVDDANDNDSGLELNGKIHYWSPTSHRITAMKLAQAVEKQVESGSIDGDSFLLSTDDDYKGMRFNWDADGQVKYATSEGFTGLSGSEWDLKELFEIYSDQLVVGAPDNHLWSSGRLGYPDNIGFNCWYVNDTGQDGVINDPLGMQAYDPKSHMFVFDKQVDVLAGLIAIEFEGTSTDSPLNINDDDYEIQVTIGVTGWGRI